MAATVSYPTETRTTVQYSLSYDADAQLFDTWRRTRTEETRREVYTGSGAQSEAEAAVASALEDSDPTTKTDGVARRCSDCGWWEAVIVTVEYSEWEKISND